jgi:protein-tyrosine phosphatase
VLQTYGIDASGHRSLEITRELIANHNLVLCLASNHKEALRAEFPDLAGRIYLLSEMVGKEMDVEDPIGGPLVEFEAAAREIDEYLTKGLDRIVALAQ